MPKSSKPRDPFAQREADKYDNPIPSRELILQEMEQIGEPVSHEELCQHLHLEGEDEQEGLRRRLIAMSRDGQIISNRRGVYGLAAHMGLVPGRVQGNKDGFGFFIPDDGSGDLFLSPREMDRLFDGDRVLARHSGFDGRGRKEGTVVEILARRYKEIVGRFYREQGLGLVVPDSKRVSHEILIPEGQCRSAQDGQYVVAELLEYPDKRRKAIGRVLEVLGDVSTPGMEIDIAVRSHGLPDQWSSAGNKEAARLPEQVAPEDQQGRFDLRELPFVTIDGEDAKDFDDAVYARRERQGGWTLFVAIADVSHYVEPGSALDEDALERGTSVYFPGHVIPMLPEKLSNGLCSLRPEVDRMTLVCEMTIAADGELRDYCFYEAVIHSHARLTYTEVADLMQEPDSPTQEKQRARLRKRYDALLGDLQNLYALYEALRDLRASRGAMDFESTETRIVFGEDRKIREIIPVVRNHAHRLVEECMLSANVATARLLEAHKLPALYRVHEGPNPEKLDSLRQFLSSLGLSLGGGEQPSPQDYQKVLAQLAGRPNSHLLQVMLIRSMMQAYYSPENLGHFGLGFEAYTHFTSPIRRYPDLLVHRAIRYLIHNKSGKQLKRHEQATKLEKQIIYPYGANDMVELGEHCSITERRADAASYTVVDWLKCEYMQSHVGDEFSGTVASVTSFGLFVELNDIYIEGLVHVTELSNDYYQFDPTTQSLRGERSGVVYHMGDTVQVRVVRVDIDDKKIDLQMVGKSDDHGGKRPDSEGGKRGAGKPAGRRKGGGGKRQAGGQPARGREAADGGKKGAEKKGAEKKGADKKAAGKKGAGRRRGGKGKAAAPSGRAKTGPSKRRR
ncbi:MAG: ribonuclease R [Pseudohongiellaceae bacterium]